MRMLSVLGWVWEGAGVGLMTAGAALEGHLTQTLTSLDDPTVHVVLTVETAGASLFPDAFGISALAVATALLLASVVHR